MPARASGVVARLFVAMFAANAFAQQPPVRRAAPTNFVVIFCDDLGYGDLGCYGHPTIRTPQLDRMATEGMRFTQFYSAAPVCTPSRAALLTGRLPVRSGMCAARPRVLFPDSAGGLPADETTLAELLQSAGYATACIGKWHLGHLPRHLPTNHGFDSYFGVPYSNDMLERAASGSRAAWPPLPLLRDEDTIESNPDQALLTERYTAAAIAFIDECTQPGSPRPFFLYLPHTMPHVPLYASERFSGRSPRGLYGDVVQTIDWSVGEVLRRLRERGAAENTLVLFTSDNGPWLTQGLRGGSAGLLRGGKGSTWEGGMRVPAIAWQPGTTPANVVSTAMGSTLDILPTCCALAGIALDSGRARDGFDLSETLRSADAKSPREEMYFYRDDTLFAVRRGPWKLHFTTQNGYGRAPDEREGPALFHVERDPSERFDVAADNPQVVAQLTEFAAKHQAAVERGPCQLEATIRGSG